MPDSFGSVKVGDYVVTNLLNDMFQVVKGVVIQIIDDKGAMKVVPGPACREVLCSDGGIIISDQNLFGTTAEFVRDVRESLRVHGRMPPE